MEANDLHGGTLTAAGATFPCTVGSFDIQQMLRADGGGFSPMLMGQATVIRATLPAGVSLHRGQRVTVTPTTGPAHVCQIVSTAEAGPLVTLTLQDVSQGA